MGLFMGFIREEATLQRMLLKNYPVVLSGLNFYAKYTVNPLSPTYFFTCPMPDDFTCEYREALQLKRGCPQKSNIKSNQTRLKNRFCSNFAQIFLILWENAPYIFWGQMLFNFEKMPF